jgi:hypothetical protein
MRGLSAGARRRDVTAVSTDDLAGYGVKVTRSGIEAAKGSADFESGGDLLHFLFTQSAGTHPAQHAVIFHKMLLPFLDFLAADYKSGEEGTSVSARRRTRA